MPPASSNDAHGAAVEQGALIEKNRAMAALDAAYGEARLLLAANFSFAGLAEKLTRMLRSNVHRRLLVQEARRKREARAQGLAKQTWRSALASVKGWISGPPKTVGTSGVSGPPVGLRSLASGIQGPPVGRNL